MASKPLIDPDVQIENLTSHSNGRTVFMTVGRIVAGPNSGRYMAMLWVQRLDQDGEILAKKVVDTRADANGWYEEIVKTQPWETRH